MLLRLAFLAVTVPLMQGCSSEKDKFLGMADDLLELSASSSDWVIYEGLPDPSLAVEFEAETSRHATFMIGDQCFYDIAVPLTQQDMESVQKIICNLKSYEESFPGNKLCGDFHADWAVAAPTDAGTVHILLCFGCRDFRLIRGNQDIKLGMASAVGERLMQTLNRLHQNLPEPLRR